jgi:hypothetical protein
VGVVDGRGGRVLEPFVRNHPQTYRVERRAGRVAPEAPQHVTDGPVERRSRVDRLPQPPDPLEELTIRKPELRVARVLAEFGFEQRGHVGNEPPRGVVRREAEDRPAIEGAAELRLVRRQVCPEHG